MRYTESHKLWLFDLAHGNISGEVVVKGFILYYVLEGLGVGNVQDDLAFHTQYGVQYAKVAMGILREELERFSGKEKV